MAKNKENTNIGDEKDKPQAAPGVENQENKTDSQEQQNPGDQKDQQGNDEKDKPQAGDTQQNSEGNGEQPKNGDDANTKDDGEEEDEKDKGTSSEGSKDPKNEKADTKKVLKIKNENRKGQSVSGMSKKPVVFDENGEAEVDEQDYEHFIKVPGYESL